MLSDELIEIGKKANRKSNMDMAEKAKEMHKKLKSAPNNYDDKLIAGVIKYVCKILNNKGFKYYKPDLFLYETPKTSKK